MEGKKLSRMALIINDVERHVVCERTRIRSLPCCAVSA